MSLFTCELKPEEKILIKDIKFSVSKKFAKFLKTKDNNKWNNVSDTNSNLLSNIDKNMPIEEFVEIINKYSKEYNSKPQKYIIVDDRYINIHNVPNFEYIIVEKEYINEFEFNFRINSDLFKPFIKNLNEYIMQCYLVPDITYFDNEIKIDSYWNCPGIQNNKLYLSYQLCNKDLTKKDIIFSGSNSGEKATYDSCKEFKRVIDELVEIYNGERKAYRKEEVE